MSFCEKFCFRREELSALFAHESPDPAFQSCSSGQILFSDDIQIFPSRYLISICPCPPLCRLSWELFGHVKDQWKRLDAREMTTELQDGKLHEFVIDCCDTPMDGLYLRQSDRTDAGSDPM
jgi:hypothetical protein